MQEVGVNRANARDEQDGDTYGRQGDKVCSWPGW